MSESKKQQKHFYLRNNDALMNSTKLSMKAKQSILLSKAENTVDAYESDWDDFVDSAQVFMEERSYLIKRYLIFQLHQKQ